ncbi:hypothetical protein PIB30_072861 [Stylosanthes scabra]|uniref:Uncharacterized protein n=1 Tax=Stylosanthes scabra TaxID=79078 RepID=A0ABU6ZN08_9FABA|nr:hypothetical protein [Stylosanthes scabra]
MKKGSLQSKKQSLEAKQSKNSTHMHGRARICVLLHTHPRLSNSVTLRCGTLASSFPRICVEVHAYAWEANKLTFQSHVYTTSNVTFTLPSLIHPRIGVEDPRICVEGTLAASNHAEPTPEPFKRDSKPR